MANITVPCRPEFGLLPTVWKHIETPKYPMKTNQIAFWRVISVGVDDVKYAGEVALALGIVETTMNSRFVRAGLPSPSVLLARARLIRIGQLITTGGFSVSDASMITRWGSPQSLGRHIRAVRGITAREFAYQFEMQGEVASYLKQLVDPHIKTWRIFDPFPEPRPANPFDGATIRRSEHYHFNEPRTR